MWNSLSRGSLASGDSWEMGTGASMFAITTDVRLRSHTKHLTACNIQFPECIGLTLFSCVMTILTSLKGLCGYERWHVLSRFLHSVSVEKFSIPLLYCKQHVIPAVQHLHIVFSCFLFCDDFTKWVNCCERAIIFGGTQTPQVPFNHSLLLHELWYIYKTIYVFWRLWSTGFELLGKLIG